MTSVYKYNGNILKTGNGIAANQDCCCENTPPPPDCSIGACDWYWDENAWIGLSPFCEEGCVCGDGPVDPPGEGDPQYINVPCQPI